MKKSGEETNNRKLIKTNCSEQANEQQNKLTRMRETGQSEENETCVRKKSMRMPDNKQLATKTNNARTHQNIFNSERKREQS